ncbi:hypothetical protein FHR34_002635 [Kitasatospora kifunensis]|uniref:Uncharacterized protein n=1 Tax=Kitasatospora kifunensis TaxID=58351 RepID=A0A7W7R1F1_KITKI|nr:hypothetical protein [Kitasatospora kifunensis]
MPQQPTASAPLGATPYPTQAQAPAAFGGGAQGGAPDGDRPDWEALADRNEAVHRRRTRMKIVVWSLAGALVLGGVVATAMVLSGSKKSGKTVAGPTASPSAPASGSAAPSPAASGSGGPGGDPSKPLWEATTDTAPLSATGLFPAQTVTVNGATWTRTIDTVTDPCWDATTGGLGSVLGDQTCRQVIRVTYVSGDSAVTLGVAVFDHQIQAENSLKNYKGHILGLSAPGAPQFCNAVGCASTHGTLGRYGYLTVEGSAKQGGIAQDAAATAAAPGFDDYIKGQLLQRAKAESSATR